jgi:PAS domain S-box-containing protein
MAWHRELLARRAAALAAGVLVVAAWVVFRIGGEQAAGAVDGLGLALASGGAAVVTALRARSERGLGVRLGWAALAVSSATFLLGELYSAALTFRGLPQPFPSLADASYLTGAAAAVVAVVLLAEWTWRGSPALLLLDGAIVAGAVLLLSALTALRAAVHTGATDPVAVAVAVAYPIADVVTMVIVVSALSLARRVDPTLLLIGLAMTCFAVSDSIFVYLQPRGNAAAGSPLDIGWLAGYALIALAGQTGRPKPAAGGGTPSSWQVLLPYAPLALSGVALPLRNPRGLPSDPASQVLLVVVVGLVLVRQLVAVLGSRSLAEWLRATSAEQRVLIERAPVGICRLDDLGRIVSANATLGAMVGQPELALRGCALSDLLHPADRAPLAELVASALDGGGASSIVDGRAVRPDGSVLWCATRVGALPATSDRGPRAVAIVEDISQRRQQAEHAAHVQRLLLPQKPPELAGYDLVGACRPAADVAGDLYDWRVSGDDLDVTVADVMGKGMASALVMAILCATLRTAPEDEGPAAVVRRAARSLGQGLPGEGLFATLFHVRVALATGRLRYVDAGHGYCAIRRADGRVVRLPVRSLPIGILSNEVFEEGEEVLEPGDVLVVFSDGLVEREERTLELREIMSQLGAGGRASDHVARLMDCLPARPADDVTVVVLSRDRDAR